MTSSSGGEGSAVDGSMTMTTGGGGRVSTSRDTFDAPRVRYFVPPDPAVVNPWLTGAAVAECDPAVTRAAVEDEKEGVPDEKLCLFIVTLLFVKLWRAPFVACCSSMGGGVGW